MRGERGRHPGPPGRHGGAHPRGGPDGLDYIVFGTRHPVEYGWLPRSRALRLGYPWVEGRDDDPWDVEAEVGELEFAEPGERPANVVGFDDVPFDVDGDKVLAEAAGAERSGLNWIRREPGRAARSRIATRSSRRPSSCSREEGRSSSGRRRHRSRGATRESFDLRPGHVVARPPGTRIAHSIVAGTDGITYLAYGTREPNDICYYPRSNKVYFRGVGLMTRLEHLDYEDGEPDL